ncbi:MAG: LTA synthase family protein [Bacteroidetes bacterium]|nr:LTA synthase family protein [Bacteroidota bacterium]
MIRSYGQETIETKNYFSNEECDNIAPYIKRVTSGNTDFDKKNIVIIILEGIGKEYIGAYTPQNNFTPFLDSLRLHATEFSNSYANGTMSIEGIPAIVAGIPSWMNNTFISSPYNGNQFPPPPPPPQFESIATVLKKEGYSTVFFHGGNNGTMGFDNFTLAAGFDKYIGRREYGNKDYDGNWGVFDKPFLEFACRQMTQLDTPFCSTIFTLSSHHPYTISDDYKELVKKGNHPFLSSVNYVDYALSNFFAMAKKTDWYEHTVFVITADHTSHRTLPYYQTRKGLYEIPLLIYDAKRPVHNEVNTCIQQIDIYPTLLGYLGYNNYVYSFGNNALLDSANTVIQYGNGAYQLISKDSLLEFDGEKFIGLYHHASDSLLQQNLKTNVESEGFMQQRLKASVQQYNNRMIKNKMAIRTAR